MKFDELFHRVATELVPTPSGASYLLSHADEGDTISSVHLTLVRRRDGTYYATQGDDRDGYTYRTDDQGNLLEFSGEEAACQWAWEQLKEARKPPPPRSLEDQTRIDAEAAASAARVKARWNKLFPDHPIT